MGAGAAPGARRSPEERHASARALARALEEVTQRLPGFETKRPYPGLASFTEEDAEYFFGREVEVEAVWKKLKRPRMLALVAPSGAGKSSFLRAGLLPSLPKGWKALIATPGNRPFQSLARALAPAFAGDAQAFQALLRFEEADAAVSLLQRFRQRHEHALVIVDQFEELFTLNPPEVAGRPSRSSSAASCSRPTCTSSSRCATTSSSAARPTRRWPRPSPTSRRSGP